jgi:hypothetical protein
MMQNELINADALFPPRVVAGTFEPALPDGCTWRLFADEELVTSGRVGPEERARLSVRAQCKADSKLALRVQLPQFIGLVSQAIEEEGGLVILDTADIACNRPVDQGGIIPFSLSTEQFC